MNALKTLLRAFLRADHYVGFLYLHRNLPETRGLSLEEIGLLFEEPNGKERRDHKRKDRPTKYEPVTSSPRDTI